MLQTGSGDDRIITTDLPFNDYIHLGAGNDMASVSRGAIDTVIGGAGDDLLIVNYSDATQRVYSSLPAGIVRESDTRQVAFDGIERFDIRTGSGDDEINTGNGDDVIRTGAGDDYIDAGLGADTVDGGAGIDAAAARWASITTAVLWDLLSGTYSGPGAWRNMEWFSVLQTGSGDDRIITTDLPFNDYIHLGAGNDMASVSRGAIDTVIGGAGDDLLIVNYSDATQRVYSSLPAGIVRESDTRQVAFDGIERFDIRTGSGDDEINTGNGDDVIRTGAGNDSLFGNAGSDTLDGGTGIDSMTGGLGNDTYFVDNVADRTIENGGEGTDIVYAAISYQLEAGASIEILSPDSLGATTALTLVGNSSVQLIYGNAGANVLTGGGGADQLVGLGGDDTYIITDGSEAVFEAAGGGSDIVYTSVSHALAGGQEIELLSTASNSATTALDLTGNEFANTIFGNDGVNNLRGGGGTGDKLIGLGGNDVYFIVAGTEQLFEAAGGGNDVVYTNLSHALVSGQEIEILSAISNSATTAMDLTGNELANLIYANDGVNNLRGGGGADVMVGYGGNDVYYIVSGTESVIEAGGGGSDVVYTNLSYALGAGQEIEVLLAVSQGATTAMNLTGNEIANQLYGNDGANVLDGGAGADFMLGYAGADTFQFNTALGGGNVDTIGDFLSGTDKIALDDAVFAGIGGLGALNAGAFVTGTQAGDADDRIIYNSATGALLFDADGSGGTAAVQFATLATGLALTVGDFIVV